MNGFVKRGLSQFFSSYEYFKIFNKEVFYNKIAYIWSLGIPIIFLAVNNFNERTSMTYEAFSQSLFFYWSYIILITAVHGIGIGLLSMRDQNFLKMYTYVTGSRFPIIFGRILSQCMFLFVSIAIFTIFSSIFYGQPIGRLLVTSLVVLIFVAIPINFLVTLTATLPVRSNNIGPVLTFLVLFLVNFSILRIETGTNWDYLVYVNDFLNPAKAIMAGSESIHSLLGGVGSNVIWFSALPLIVYLVIGSIGCKRMSIISKEGR